MEEFSDKNKAKLLFKEANTSPLVNKVFCDSFSVYEYELCLSDCEKTLIFPWDDWGLFSLMKEHCLLSLENKLFSIPAKNVVTQYNRFYESLQGGKHNIRLENLKKQMKDGYKNINPILLAFESGTKNTFYVIDGIHRIITCLDLVNSGKIKYEPIKCVLVEVKDINQTIGVFSCLLKG